MIIAADGVDVQLGDHRVTCTSKGDTGILLTARRDVEIRDGSVDGCGVGVSLQGGSGNVLRNLVVTGNGYGVHLGGSSGNSIVSVRSAHNEVAGIDLTSGVGGATSNDNTLRDAVLNSNGLDGLELDGGSSHNTVTSSEMSQNVRFGTYARFPTDHDNVLRSNTMSGNGSSGLVTSGSASTFLLNTLQHNGGAGIELQGSRNLVQSNEASDNIGNGIAIGQSGSPTIGNTLRANEALGNGGYDLADYSPGKCTGGVWVLNVGHKLLKGCE